MLQLVTYVGPLLTLEFLLLSEYGNSNKCLGICGFAIKWNDTMGMKSLTLCSFANFDAVLDEWFYGVGDESFEEVVGSSVVGTFQWGVRRRVPRYVSVCQVLGCDHFFCSTSRVIEFYVSSVF